jgi:hypothetical protein
MVCQIEGCDKPHKSKGYCDTHYAYWRRNGKEWSAGVGDIKPMAGKFWPKVDVRGPDECWPWKAAVYRATGYGLIGKGGLGAGSVGAHRVSYELNCGPIPAGMVVMHTCDNRICVNPAHLRLGTHKDNTQDMMRKGRHKRAAARGEALHFSKLNEEKVRYIRANPEMSLKELSGDLGVAVQTIHHVRSGRTWAHVT